MGNKTAITSKNAKDIDKTSKRKRTIKNIFRAMWIIFALGVISVVIIIGLIANGHIGYMPNIDELNHPIDKYASQIISDDGEILGTYSTVKNNRIYSKYSDLPKSMVEALVATEDERFYKHSGVDIYSILRAIARTGLLGDKSGGGGSTITQQLAKQLYSPQANSKFDRILQKPIEWIIAAKLEKAYTKEEILNLYLNQFDFLYNAVGASLAANVYFNKPLKDLKTEESATLVGMCKNPSYFNPIRRPEKTKERRNVVLGQMLRSNYIDKQQFDSLKALPLELSFNKLEHTDGLAPYFREYLRKIMTAKEPKKEDYIFNKEQFRGDSINWVENPLYGWINKNTKPDGSKYSLASDGLKIHTTIDSRMQRYAEEAVKEHIGGYLQPAFDKEKKNSDTRPYARNVDKKRFEQLMSRAVKNSERYRKLKQEDVSEVEIKKIFDKKVEMKVFSWKGPIDTIMSPYDSIRYHKQFLHTGFMAMENKTGNVKAYVGDIDFEFFKYDMVNQGRRQTGSTFKPFLYALAMQDGASPCDEMVHVANTYYDANNRPWTPKNAGAKRVGESVTLKWGLQNSSNWVTAYLMNKTTPEALERWLRAFGINGDIEPVISMCLGTDGVTVAEMASAYTTFANKGERTNPIYVTSIEDQHGNTIADFTNPQEINEIFGFRAYMQMLDMLQSVIEGGTGSRIRFKYKLKGEMGGKTGTTQENADGWFMGFTPSLSTATWVGGEERDIRFAQMAYGQGASSALPVYGLFMQKVYADPTLPYSQDEKFEKIDSIDICPPKFIGEDIMSTEIDAIFN